MFVPQVGDLHAGTETWIVMGMLNPGMSDWILGGDGRNGEAGMGRDSAERGEGSSEMGRRNAQADCLHVPSTREMS